jgi:hypothetical protein
MIEILSTDYTQWELNLGMLRKRLDLPRRPFDKAIKELKEYKYMEQKCIGNHKYSYTIYEIGDAKTTTNEEPIKENMKQKCERKRRETDYFKNNKIQTVHGKTS